VSEILTLIVAMALAALGLLIAWTALVVIAGLVVAILESRDER